ncbi:LysR family transcriptional regulator [Marinicella gelatinilytica]|uniref:LysR family transcriptional regulator n=1 Tax=Marinicella gelatinilytica TaxID=2996017 RepID=UPI0022608740|nr:LysR family transcriptional regulator [Marinicella gelatinilytica]MCX7544114.1 LysR family transcriptional regulator [Marinicella gelatinilytica]
MKLEYLQYFVTVAQTGSISQAAAQLERNRSTISMAISSFEDYLGAKLFVRKGNSMQLSSAGERILDDAIRIINLTMRIQRKVTIDQLDEMLTLRLGRDDALPESFWRIIIRRIRRKFPGLALEMNYASPDYLREQVLQGEVDMACCLLREQSVTEQNLHVQVIGKLAMQMMVATGHPLSRMAYVSNDDLSAVPQIAYLGNGEDDSYGLDSVMGERISLSSFELVRDAVCDGLGWGYVPMPLVSASVSPELSLLQHGLNETWHSYVAYCHEPLTDADSIMGHISGLIRHELETLLKSPKTYAE